MQTSFVIIHSTKWWSSINHMENKALSLWQKSKNHRAMVWLSHNKTVKSNVSWRSLPLSWATRSMQGFICSILILSIAFQISQLQLKESFSRQWLKTKNCISMQCLVTGWISVNLKTTWSDKPCTLMLKCKNKTESRKKVTTVVGSSCTNQQQFTLLLNLVQML